MASVNRATLVGHVGKDPSIRSLNNGEKVASFSLATSERWTDKRTNEKKEKSEWHNVVVFNDNLVKLVEEYVKKGSRLYIDGQIQTRKWQDQKGDDRYTTEIVLQKFRGDLVLLDRRDDQRGDRSGDDKPSERSSTKGGDRQSSAPARPDLDDDIPF